LPIAPVNVDPETAGTVPKHRPGSRLTSPGRRRGSVSDERVHAVAVGRDGGHVITGGTDRRLRLWDVTSPGLSRVLAAGAGDTCDDGGGVFGCEVLRGPHGDLRHIYHRPAPPAAPARPAAELAAAGGGGGRGGVAAAAAGHADGIADLAVVRLPGGNRLLSAGRDGIVKVWC
jgi:WD40 repeat protein